MIFKGLGEAVLCDSSWDHGRHYTSVRKESLVLLSFGKDFVVKFVIFTFM